jgi:MoxR-like ATPase
MIEYKNEVEAAESLKAAYEKLKKEISKVIIGQDEVVKLVLSIEFNLHLT